MTPTSPTRAKEGGLTRDPVANLQRDGFTLVELLIVITLLTTLTAMLAPVLLPSPARELRAAAGEIATTLRETRRRAREARQRQRFVVDTRIGRFGIKGTPIWRTLPEDLKAELTTAQSLVTGDDQGGIDFFPDGSSTGGRVRLGIADRSVRVDIEWLTGRISVAEAE